MLNVSELAARIDSKRTALFLGAGASIPSGAPTAEQLGKELAAGVQQKYPGGDLMEAAQILERKVTRARLIDVLVQRLSGLTPTGGMLALPDFDWPVIYSTNYDVLVEKSYKACNVPLVVVRSNYEWDKQQGGTTTLFKIHGCISKDISRGDRSRIVLTERDYDEYSDFRKMLFQRLALDLMSRDVVFVGYSLRDRHVRDEVKQATRLKRDQGAPGRIYVLVYEEDPDRAAFMEEELGVEVCFGSLDPLMHALATKNAADRRQPAEPACSEDQWLLPLSIRASTRDIRHSSSNNPNSSRLFSGSPATFADIAAGFTFRRSMEAPMIQRIDAGAACVSLIGVSGVGKTTLARRVAHQVAQRGVEVWEHDTHFPLDVKEWARVSGLLKERGRRGLLLIDDCTTVMGSINRLLEDHLLQQENPGLQLLLIAERAAWSPRRKSRFIFHDNQNNLFTLSLLDAADIERMVELTERSEEIRRLMSKDYSRLDHSTRLHRIAQRCSADMFVSLKYVFGTESLDAIILREYASLPPDLQDIYRTVSALEVSGTRVHRQLIIRLLNVQSYTLQGLLALLEGIVDEYDIDRREGIYGWRTRHSVIARLITEYKYNNHDEFLALIENIVEELNPSIRLEQQTIASLCNAEFGIRRISSVEQRIRLYERLIAKAPHERIPYHRLIGDLIRAERYDEAENQLRLAIEQVGIDPPLHRYRVRLALERAQRLVGIQTSDRRVMLERAYDLAHEGIRKYPSDKYAYMIFESIGLAFERLCGDSEYLEEAVGILKSGYEKTLDPELGEQIDRAMRAYYQPRPQMPQ